jgi:hypothetical protein
MVCASFVTSSNGLSWVNLLSPSHSVFPGVFWLRSHNIADDEIRIVLKEISYSPPRTL